MVNVTICAGLVVPTVWLPNVRLLAERPPVGSKPTPLSTTVWLATLSTIVSVPSRVPVDIGVNVT